MCSVASAGKANSQKTVCGDPTVINKQAIYWSDYCDRTTRVATAAIFIVEAIKVLLHICTLAEVEFNAGKKGNEKAVFLTGCVG